MMASLKRSFRRLWLIGCLALGLAIGSAAISPLLNEEIASSLLNGAVVLADECENVTCG